MRLVAQASRLFSTSSLITEAGFSTTSQAFSLLIKYSGSFCIATMYAQKINIFLFQYLKIYIICLESIQINNKLLAFFCENNIILVVYFCICIFAMKQLFSLLFQHIVQVKYFLVVVVIFAMIISIRTYLNFVAIEDAVSGVEYKTNLLEDGMNL